MHGILISPVGDVAAAARAAARDAGRPPCSSTGSRALTTVLARSRSTTCAGGQLAVEHLIARGSPAHRLRRRAARIRQVTDRLAGAREAVAAPRGGRARGRRGAGRSRSSRAAPPARRSSAPGRRSARTRVFAANDLVAMGVLQALVMLGDLRVPDDIALIGYDDIDFARAAVVPLSSIRQPSALIGQTAMDILQDEIDDPTREPRRVVFAPELVVRASTVAGSAPA